MKNLRSVILFATVFLATSLVAQNTKHSITSAKVVYELTAVSDKTVNEKPKNFTLYFKKDMSRVEMQTSKGNMIMISDNLANIGYLLMDMSGKKMAMKTTRMSELRKKGISEEPKVELTRESKMIAGYTCYKAIVTTKTNSGTKVYDVWFTSELKGSYSYDSKINGINGLMMEFESVNDGKVFKMTAKSVESIDDLSDDLFKVPSDYQIMDMSNYKPGQAK